MSRASSFHQAYGLHLASDAPVPWLPVQPPHRADVFVHFHGGPGPDAEVELRLPRRGPRHHAADRLEGTLAIVYDDGTRFVVDPTGSNIWCTWPAPYTMEDVATYLLGSILGLVLRRRGVVCLHASAVKVDDGAILFAGPGGAGKSTTAAAFMRAGHAPVADDVSAVDYLDGRVTVRTAYPLLRLWPDSTRALYGEESRVPLLTPNWDKRRVDFGKGQSAGSPRSTPIDAIFVLRARTAVRNASVELMTGTQALMALVANSHPADMLTPATRASELATFAAVTAAVPVYSLAAPDDTGIIDVAMHAILDTVRATRA